MNFNKLEQIFNTEHDHHPKVFYNLTRREKQGLRWLQNQEDLLVVSADKNMGLCVIDRSEYDKRITNELNQTPDAFQPMNTSIEELTSKRLIQMDKIIFLFKMIKVDIGGVKLAQYIEETARPPFSLSIIQGMPKVHKPGERMRLIYPFNKHPLSRLHQFIAKSLEPIVLRLPSVITHVMEVINQVSQKEFPADTLFCTADIKSMYPNIDRKCALKMAQIALQSTEFDCFNKYSDWNWRQLLEISYQDLEFSFQNKLFQHTKGVLMGSPAGPQLAMIYLHQIIRSKWERIQPTIFFGGFYFDDALFIFKPSINKQQAKDTLNHLLNCSSLKFDEDSFNILTVNEMLQQDFNFLDISITTTQEQESFRCHTKVYCKPMGLYQYVHWKSAHPPSLKRGIIKGEIIRRLRLTDRLEDWWKTCMDLTNKFVQRGYPKSIIEKIKDSINFNQRTEYRDKLIVKLQTRRANVKFPFNNQLQLPPEVTTIPLLTRYDPSNLRNMKKRRRVLDEFLEEGLLAINSRIKRARITNAMTVGTTIRNLLSNSSTPKPSTNSGDCPVESVNNT